MVQIKINKPYEKFSLNAYYLHNCYQKTKLLRRYYMHVGELESYEIELLLKTVVVKWSVIQQSWCWISEVLPMPSQYSEPFLVAQIPNQAVPRD